MMKKTITWLLVALIVSVVFLSGCSALVETTSSAATNPPAEAAAEVPAVEPAPAVQTPSAEAVKTGIAVITAFGKSKNATAEADGTAQADITYVAVTVDDNGVIDQCVIDTVQSKIQFDAAGAITTDLATRFDSKNVLKDSYGMKAASGIGKEWHEQAAALAAYAQGKTVDQVLGIALDDTGHVTEADLVSSVTISVTTYQQAIAKAAANAQHLGAHKGDALKANSQTSIAKSKNAESDKDGLAQAYATLMALTLDAQGTITSCAIDSVQANVNFNATGAITSDLTAAAQTKQELGDGYGMKAASGIGKEWFEQANAFAAHVTGKPLAEAAGLTLEDGKAVDLVSSVTIGAGDFVKLLAMAQQG